VNTSFLQHLLTNSHHKFRKITKILSRYSNFYAIVSKAKLNFKIEVERKTWKKKNIQNVQKKFVYFKA
jgi:hypothetical protein